MLGPLHQVCTQRVPLNVSQYCQQVMIVFDRKRFESPLPNVPAATVVLVGAPHMRCQQPLHPYSQIAIVMRPKHKVKMIRHQAIGQNAHRRSSTSLLKQFGERRVVAVLVKHLLPVIAAIGDVTTNPADRRACGAWHGALGVGRGHSAFSPCEPPTEYHVSGWRKSRMSLSSPTRVPEAGRRESSE